MMLDKIIELTKTTVPHPYEEQLIGHLLPENAAMDEYGNYFLQVGESRVAFTSHLDTVGRTPKDVKHVFDGRFLKTDGSTILGADDKAGVALMLHMIENNVPGLYCFFVGEEKGTIGSLEAAADGWRFEGIDIMLSFDRKGYHSIITHQMASRCCSDEFAASLSDQFMEQGMFLTADDTGSYTDSANFVDYIPECTNISMGYFDEHTKREKLDIPYLEKLAEAVVAIDWESLPAIRRAQMASYQMMYSEDMDIHELLNGEEA